MTGCTVNAYLFDNIANRRVVNKLTDLIAESNNVLLQDHCLMLKLLVTQMYTSLGTEYRGRLPETELPCAPLLGPKSMTVIL